jgi:hypothetical protein
MGLLDLYYYGDGFSGVAALHEFTQCDKDFVQNQLRELVAGRVRLFQQVADAENGGESAVIPAGAVLNRKHFILLNVLGEFFTYVIDLAAGAGVVIVREETARRAEDSRVVMLSVMKKRGKRAAAAAVQNVKKELRRTNSLGSLTRSRSEDLRRQEQVDRPKKFSRQGGKKTLRRSNSAGLLRTNCDESVSTVASITELCRSTSTSSWAPRGVKQTLELDGDAGPPPSVSKKRSSFVSRRSASGLLSRSWTLDLDPDSDAGPKTPSVAKRRASFVSRRPSSFAKFEIGKRRKMSMRPLRPPAMSSSDTLAAGTSEMVRKPKPIKTFPVLVNFICRPVRGPVDGTFLNYLNGIKKMTQQLKGGSYAVFFRGFMVWLVTVATGLPLWRAPTASKGGVFPDLNANPALMVAFMVGDVGGDNRSRLSSQLLGVLLGIASYATLIEYLDNQYAGVYFSAPDRSDLHDIGPVLNGESFKLLGYLSLIPCHFFMYILLYSVLISSNEGYFNPEFQRIALYATAFMSYDHYVGRAASWETCSLGSSACFAMVCVVLAEKIWSAVLRQRNLGLPLSAKPLFESLKRMFEPFERFTEQSADVEDNGDREEGDLASVSTTTPNGGGGSRAGDHSAAKLASMISWTQIGLQAAGGVVATFTLFQAELWKSEQALKWEPNVLVLRINEFLMQMGSKLILAAHIGKSLFRSQHFEDSSSACNGGPMLAVEHCIKAGDILQSQEDANAFYRWLAATLAAMESETDQLQTMGREIYQVFHRVVSLWTSLQSQKRQDFVTARKERRGKSIARNMKKAIAKGRRKAMMAWKRWREGSKRGEPAQEQEHNYMEVTTAEWIALSGDWEGRRGRHKDDTVF